MGMEAPAKDEKPMAYITRGRCGRILVIVSAQ